MELQPRKCLTQNHPARVEVRMQERGQGQRGWPWIGRRRQLTPGPAGRFGASQSLSFSCHLGMLHLLCLSLRPGRNVR